ncbi:hypothetical protein R0K30_02215 [Bacillus sp. SIMBA_154]|uniref:hypothetical protein n=1 Tax=Bacillus sp. SIMBA_154 TaxID=3080859 RepID=UPI00397D3562
MTKRYKTIPYELKQTLRQYGKAVARMNTLHYKITEELERYNVPIDHVIGDTEEEPWNESLTLISYNEGDIEDNIAELEKVFLHFANKYLEEER